jgi:hypothetical protein
MKMSPTTRRFRNVFLTIIGLCILTMIVSEKSFDLVEADTARGWTIKYFALPIFIVMILCCSYFYIKFIKEHESKVHKKKIWNQLRAIFTILMLTIGLAAILTLTTHSLILLSNAYMGDHRTIYLKATIVDYYTTKNKGRTHHYIRIQEAQLDKIITFEVEKPYEIGQPFDKTMQIGKWELLYSQ